MRVKYVSGEKFYLVSNHAVAINPLFKDKYYCVRFLHKLKFYLSPLCEILSYSFSNHEFQLMVRLKSRESFESYFKNKYPKKIKKGVSIPKETYIFSQAMANLQSSMAIHFNRKEGRTGALFARRFSKTLIERAEEFEKWMERMKGMKNFLSYEKEWAFRKNVIYNRSWYRQFCFVKIGESKKFFENRGYLVDLEAHLVKTTNIISILVFQFMETVKFKPD